MELWVALIAALPSLAGLLYTILKDKRQDHSTLGRAIGFLLLRALRHDAGESIRRGYITPSELEILEESYDLYKRLGGNGFADALLIQIRKLPLKGVQNEK